MPAAMVNFQCTDSFDERTLFYSVKVLQRLKLTRYCTFHLNTYELPETQWAAETTQVAEINDPPQIKRP